MKYADKSYDEEITAIRLYEERIANCSDDKLRKVLEHNRDEEMIHAAMLLKWIKANSD